MSDAFWERQPSNEDTKCIRLDKPDDNNYRLFNDKGCGSDNEYICEAP